MTIPQEMTVPQLREALKERGLSAAGRKPELAGRLQAALASASAVAQGGGEEAPADQTVTEPGADIKDEAPTEVPTGDDPAAAAVVSAVEGKEDVNIDDEDNDDDDDDDDDDEEEEDNEDEEDSDEESDEDEEEEEEKEPAAAAPVTNADKKKKQAPLAAAVEESLKKRKRGLSDGTGTDAGAKHVKQDADAADATGQYIVDQATGKATMELMCKGSEGRIIGKGGETIRYIEARFKVKVDMKRDRGTCFITGPVEIMVEARRVVTEIIEKGFDVRDLDDGSGGGGGG
eukprot:CAMPEP_0181368918 /NCGR_PEP_ID=MMETSP1106-20121128/12419_1 /TAXON_ID=81844 /ORGANISM="Mantoniella antarctica, Strain SL-175" /LENGTH=287 /DNA_ID=CAMNT_0023485217 /DNA_START=44 /DNA_END=904 /DNA_ORIENTATION=+